MQKPRLIYYNDAHHFHAKRIEPPASIHKLQQPVDEVLGTGVDLLVLGLGYSDVYFHQSKVGRVVGQMKDVWANYIDWRIMRMVESAAQLGTDQVREVIGRGREMGLRVFPSLKMNDSAPLDSERCGILKLEHKADVCVGDPGRAQWCYDYANELVQEHKLAVIREILEEYEADGIELDFKFESVYFKQSEIANNASLMSSYISRVRDMAKNVGEKQGRQIGIMARVDLDREVNLLMGLDVETWLEEGSIDYVVGQEPANVTDTEKKPHWMPEIANSNGAAAYYRPPRRVYDERAALPHIEMYRALRQTLADQGYAGLYDGYLPWPLASREYQMLRELAYPEAAIRKDKRFLLQPREGLLGEQTTTPNRILPIELVEQMTHNVNIHVADDLNSAKQDKEMRKPLLTLRFSFFCIEDDIEFRFNGRILPWEDAEIDDERALRMKVSLAGNMSVQAPLGMSAHWFRYRLDLSDLKHGENTLEIECKKFDKRAGFVRSLNGLEVQTRYKDFVRPEGLEIDRVDPGVG